MDSGGNQPNQGTQFQDCQGKQGFCQGFRQNPKPNQQSNDIIKAPPKKDPILMQYSSNISTTEDAEEDDKVQTFLSFLSNSKFNVNNAKTFKANTDVWVMLVNNTKDLCIPYGGADSYVGGSA